MHRPLYSAACLTLALCVLSAESGWAQSAAGPPPTRKLLVIGVDGLRPDALAAAQTPNIDALVRNGAYSAEAQSEDLTFSGPNWSTILHGVHRDKHNVTTNGYSGSQLAQYPDLFAYLEAHDSSWNTVRLTTWDAIFQYQPTGADVDLYHSYASNGDNIVTQWAVELLSGTHSGYPGLDVDALFIYLADPDIAGHGYGFHPSVPQYLQELEDVDRQVGLIMNALHARPSYASEDWLVILTSDHGGSINGGHSGNTWERRQIPFLVCGNSVQRKQTLETARNVDVVATALTFMRVPLDPRLDGRPLGLAGYGPQPAGYGLNLIRNPGAEHDRGFDSESPDQYVSAWRDPGPEQMTAIRYGSSGFPAQGDPGPPNRGENFFSGSGNGVQELSQSIDLRRFASVVDSGSARYELSGWLGGWLNQEDAPSCAPTSSTVPGRSSVGTASDPSRPPIAAT